MTIIIPLKGQHKMKHKEVFIPIMGYEDSYLLSENGFVFSLKNNKAIALRKSGDCYLQVRLCKSGSIKYFYIHRLLAIYFIPNPNEYNEVNHIDGNQTNNSISNLEWCTPSHNIAQSWAFGTRSLRYASIIELTTGFVFDTIRELAASKNKTYRSMVRMIKYTHPFNYHRFK